MEFLSTFLSRREAAEGRLVIEGAVWSLLVVPPQPAEERSAAVERPGVGRRVGPLAQHRLSPPSLLINAAVENDPKRLVPVDEALCVAR